MAENYIKQGCFLVCDKGSAPTEFKITHFGNTSIHGENIATDKNKDPIINVQPFGGCINIKSCIPAPKEWYLKSTLVTTAGAELLLDKSQIECSNGGCIKIFASIQEACAAIEAREKGKSGTDKIKDKLASYIGDSSVGRFALGLGGGLGNTVEGLGTLVYDRGKKILTDPIGMLKDDYQTAKNIATKAKELGANVINDPAKALNDAKQASADLYEKAKHMNAEDFGNLTSNIIPPAGAAAKIAGKLGSISKVAKAMDKASDLAKAAKTAAVAKASKAVLKATPKALKAGGKGIASGISKTAGTAKKLAKASKAALKATPETLKKRAKKGADVGKKATKTAAKKTSKVAGPVIIKAGAKVKNKAANVKQWIKCNIFRKDPVDPVTGNVFYPYTDFELPGPIPLKWEREYHSKSSYKGILGHGIYSVFDLVLTENTIENSIEILQKDGEIFAVEKPSEEQSSYHQIEQIEVSVYNNSYQVFDYKSRLKYIYNLVANDLHKPVMIEDENGFFIQLTYSEGKLIRILDSANRILNIENNNQGFITAIYCLTEAENRLLVSYTYDSDGNMVEITDAIKQKTTIDYDSRHHMIKKTDRNGQSFYWKYDNQNRCIHTWGDGGLQEGFFEYYQGYTIHTDPTNLKEVFYYNQLNQVVKETDAFGNSKLHNYNELGQKIEDIDEEGLVTRYHYDDNGNMVKKELPDGASYTYIYDEENRLKLIADPMGNHRQWYYYKGRLYGVELENEERTSFVYNEKNLISKIQNDAGDETLLTYDDQYNLIEMVLPDGRNTQWKYNELGECTEVINPLGKKQQFEYDRLGRLKQVKLPTAEVVDLKYDAYDNVLKVNNLRKKIEYTYTPLGSVKSRTENGVKVTFDYDQQERLESLSNEKGDPYKFFRNERGDIVKEVSFDGITKYYNRDRAGKVVKIKREGNRFTKYEYDKGGRIIRADYHDGYWETFEYNKIGLLTAARNPNTDILFTRNRLGLVTQEKQGEHSIDYHYDEKGNLLSVQSSLGASISYERDRNGFINSIQVGKEENAWIANIKRNMLGLEIERSLPGGIKSTWSYDDHYHPTAQTIMKGQEHVLKRNYSWDANRQLQSITNVLTNGVTTFQYDMLDNLASAQYEDGGHDDKLPDEIGSLFRTKTKKDRIYGKGGKLLKDENWFYSYDTEGNLRLKSKRNIVQAQLQNNQIQLEENRLARHSFFVEEIKDEKPKQKTLDYYLRTDIKFTQEDKEEYKRLKKQLQVQDEEWQHGDWQYTWQANGMLKSVKKPDGSLVEFEYDALGRRTAKIYHEKVTRFVWDGNILLHEWNYERKKRPSFSLDNEGEFVYTSAETIENLITWIYEDGGFVPSAKIVGEEKYSIISDYIGRPIQAYSEHGEKAWETDYDIYGKLRSLQGDKNFVPFRQLGQYEDEELDSLYYNRFRYYDCNIGGYISQDPIGLEGTNPNLYAYVHDSNSWVDQFGLKECPLWRKAKKDYWKNKYANEITKPTGKYSQKNLARMKKGNAPQMKVEISDASGNKIIRDVPIELHHIYLPQRLGTPKAHEFWNLAEATPWGHAGMDPYRRLGDNFNLERIINGTNSW